MPSAILSAWLIPQLARNTQIGHYTEILADTIIARGFFTITPAINRDRIFAMAATETNHTAKDKIDRPAGKHSIRCRHCGKLIIESDLIGSGGVKLCPNCRLAIDEAYYA
jgi:hypothetical protein